MPACSRATSASARCSADTRRGVPNRVPSIGRARTKPGPDSGIGTPEGNVPEDVVPSEAERGASASAP